MFQVLVMLLECFNLLFLINYFFVVVTLFPLTRNFAPLCLCLYPGEPYSHLISRVFNLAIFAILQYSTLP